MSFQQFLLELFNPSPNYSLALSLQKLRSYGGISNLLNNLSIDPRQVRQVYQKTNTDCGYQIKLQENMQNKKRISHRDFLLQNVLLYLITLSFFTKLLLYTQELRSQLDLYTQIIGFIFLVFIIHSKKGRVNSQQITELHNRETKYQQKIMKIRRKGQQILLNYSKIQQGDIVCFKKGDLIDIDGILLDIDQESTVLNKHEDKQECKITEKYITVSEEETNTGRNQCKKHSIWKAYNIQHFDPFVLANSQILDGEAWILVLLTGKWASNKRAKDQAQIGGLSELSRVGRQVSQIMRGVIGILVCLLGLRWLGVDAVHHYEMFLELIYVISCLFLYLSYVNHNEMLAFIDKYFRQQIHKKQYRILNPLFLVNLTDAELMVFESDCLNLQKKTIKEKLTQLNSKIDVKIVYNKEKRQIYNIFGDIEDSLIFTQNDELLPLRQRLDELANCKIIKSSYENFRNYYLRLLKDMNFKMVYISKERDAMMNNDQLISIKCSTPSSGGAYSQFLQGQWLRLSSDQPVQQVVLDLFKKSEIFSKLKDCYYAILLNSCIELIILTGWALSGCMIDLNLNLLIIYINRQRALQLYNSIIESATKNEHKQKRNMPLYIQFNLFLSIYYLYMMIQVYKSPNRQFQLFLLLMANRLFRIEGLQKPVESTKTKILRYVKKNMILIALILAEGAWKWYFSKINDLLTETLDILVLPIILLMYSMFF